MNGTSALTRQQKWLAVSNAVLTGYLVLVSSAAIASIFGDRVTGLLISFGAAYNAAQTAYVVAMHPRAPAPDPAPPRDRV